MARNLSKRLNSILSNVNLKRKFRFSFSKVRIASLSISNHGTERYLHSHERIKFTKGLNSKIQIPLLERKPRPGKWIRIT